MKHSLPLTILGYSTTSSFAPGNISSKRQDDLKFMKNTINYHFKA